MANEPRKASAVLQPEVAAKYALTLENLVEGQTIICPKSNIKKKCASKIDLATADRMVEAGSTIFRAKAPASSTPQASTTNDAAAETGKANKK